MSKPKYLLVVFLVIITGAYLLGPKPERAELNNDLPSLPAGMRNIESFIEKKEAGFKIKPDNEARIVWVDETARSRTEYSLLYLHGFSASWMEGFPVNTAVANYFGMNAYFPRLASHGLQTDEPLLDMKPDKLWESAKEALLVASSIGEKVIK